MRRAEREIEKYFHLQRKKARNILKNIFWTILRLFLVKKITEFVNKKKWETIWKITSKCFQIYSI